MSTAACNHPLVSCLNQHELIRKYCCAGCAAVMMCACDERFGRRHLAHQLREGCELKTQARVAVTAGFQPGICDECRGSPPQAAPAASIPGRTSKIKRYYWREIIFAEIAAQADWDAHHPAAGEDERQQAAERIGRDVLDAVKARHASDPKYVFDEPSQAEIIARFSVQVEALSASYAAVGAKGAQILLDGAVISPEAFATQYYEALGWSVLPLESVPFHALFGIMMWLVIQDPADTHQNVVSFGARDVFEATREKAPIWTSLPSDFGTTGYAARRAPEIEKHFETFAGPRDELLWMFDLWREPSEHLRQYLWAHRADDVARAQALVATLPPQTVVAILRYLVDGYWNHYLGWPDLLLHRADEFMLVEVKSSGDKLSNDQKRWIADNHGGMRLPFRIAKIHRVA